MTFDQKFRDGLTYAFGHAVSSHIEGDAHSGDSGDLAIDVMSDLGLTEEAIDMVMVLAEHVHGNYDYTGRGEELRRRIERGEV